MGLLSGGIEKGRGEDCIRMSVFFVDCLEEGFCQSSGFTLKTRFEDGVCFCGADDL